MTSRTLRRRLAGRRDVPVRSVVSRAVPRGPSINVTVQLAPGISESFLIMSGGTHRVWLQGYIQNVSPVLRGQLASVPVTITARVA